MTGIYIPIMKSGGHFGKCPPLIGLLYLEPNSLAVFTTA